MGGRTTVAMEGEDPLIRRADGARQVRFQSLLPLWREPGERLFLPLLDYGKTQVTSIAFVEVERLDAVRRGPARVEIRPAAVAITVILPWAAS